MLPDNIDFHLPHHNSIRYARARECDVEWQRIVPLNHKDRSDMNIIGIDPGLRRAGYAILRMGGPKPKCIEGGIIRTKPETSLADRILEIGQGLTDILTQHPIETLAIEQVFSLPKNPKSALLMAHARGTILYVARHHGLKVTHYTPTQIKRTLTGSGRAPKDQIEAAVRQELGFKQPLEPHDLSDAFAIAICHFYHAQQSLLIS